MSPFLRNIPTIILLLINTSTFANDSSYVKFIFSDSLPAAKFTITVYDGLREHRIDPQNTQHWRGKLLAPYGLIVFGYPDTDTSFVTTKVFFKKGHSEVHLISSSISGQYYALDERSSVNIVPYSEMGGPAFEAFIKERQDTLMAFYRRYKHYFGRNNALVEKVFILSDSLLAKKIEFIKQFPDLYVSFWTFLNEVIKTDFLRPEKLAELYHTAFTDKYKRSEAAGHIESILQNKLAVASGEEFPDFSAVDIHNNKIESAKLRGSYVLIQFWASWCVPCIQEMPELKKIHDKYDGPGFRLISFSIDKNLSAARKAIEKHSMNWTQVTGDDRLYRSLAYTPIPQLYLVDKTGHTIYNNTTTPDPGLARLKKLLSAHLDKPQAPVPSSPIIFLPQYANKVLFLIYPTDSHITESQKNRTTGMVVYYEATGR